MVSCVCLCECLCVRMPQVGFHAYALFIHALHMSEHTYLCTLVRLVVD